MTPDVLSKWGLVGAFGLGVVAALHPCPLSTLAGALLLVLVHRIGTTRRDKREGSSAQRAPTATHTPQWSRSVWRAGALVLGMVVALAVVATLIGGGLMRVHLFSTVLRARAAFFSPAVADRGGNPPDGFVRCFPWITCRNRDRTMVEDRHSHPPPHVRLGNGAGPIILPGDSRRVFRGTDPVGDDAATAGAVRDCLCPRLWSSPIGRRSLPGRRHTLRYRAALRRRRFGAERMGTDGSRNLADVATDLMLPDRSVPLGVISVFVGQSWRFRRR